MNNKIKWFKKEEIDRVVFKKINPALVGLDIGAGIMPHDYLKAIIHVCCEPYKEYVDVLMKNISEKEDKVYIVQQKDWFESVSKLKDKSVDSVYLIDVIEHLPKDDGAKLLKMTERVARKQIVIFTPIGFIKQEILEGGKDAWGLNGAEFQEHKSGWLPEDFDETWNIYACKDYHITNNVGEKLKEPFGAFWAIKNFDDKNDADNLSLDLSSHEIKDALINQLPHKYFELVEKTKQGEMRNQQIQVEHQKLQAEHQQLIDTKFVQFGRAVNRYLRKIGIKF